MSAHVLSEPWLADESHLSFVQSQETGEDDDRDTRPALPVRSLIAYPYIRTRLTRLELRRILPSQLRNRLREDLVE